MIVMSDFAELNDFSSFFIFACCAKTTKQVSGVVATTFLIEEEIKEIMHYASQGLKYTYIM